MPDKDLPNPYQPPQENPFGEVYQPPGSPFESGIQPNGLWRQGNLLVLDKFAQLPNRCVKSNEPTTRRLKRNLSWHHPAVFVAILLHLFIYVILALILRKTATIYIGLSDHWFAKRRRTMLISWILVLLSIALICVGGFYVDSPNSSDLVWLIPIGIFLFIGAALYGLIASRMVVAKRINDRYVWLKGIHPDFLADLPPWPHSYG